jgi:hypothetical protein
MASIVPNRANVRPLHTAYAAGALTVVSDDKRR